MDVCLCGLIVSTPDTLQHSFYYVSRVDIFVCVRVVVCAFLKCHFEPVWPVRNGLRQIILFWLTDNLAIYYPSIHFYFCPLVTTHLFASGIHTTIWSYSIRTHFFLQYLYLQPCALRAPTRWPKTLVWLHSKKMSLPNSLFFFFSCLFTCTSIVKMGKVAHSIFCLLLQTYVYLRICVHISPLYVCRNYECKSVRCLIFLLGDVALLGVLWQE